MNIMYEDVKIKYKTGMYGGKFLPMHKGHLSCIEKASKICDKLYLILFVGGAYEKINRTFLKDDFCSFQYRYNQVLTTSEMFDNIHPLYIDVSECFAEDGSEDWDAETPLVIQSCGHFDAVFSSEPSYSDYFNRAYPWADHILIDPLRKEVPISATKIRYELNEDERKKWII